MIYDYDGYPFFPQPVDNMIGFVKQSDDSVLVLYRFDSILETLIMSGLTPLEAQYYFHIPDQQQCKVDQGLL